MDFNSFFGNKGIKPKEKTELLSKWLIENSDSIDMLAEFAAKSKDSAKATCIEAMEFATKVKPDLITKIWFGFVVSSLSEKAPRVKWESAKVIGNVAFRFLTELDEAIVRLLENSEHEGTVVRWSAAYALSEILKLNTSLNVSLLPAIESICKREEKNSIKKIYLDAIKKLN